MSEKQNTYLMVADAIKSEKRAWCKGDWSETDESGTKVVSRCLVDHIDAITGVYKVVGYKEVPHSEEDVFAGYGKSHMEPIIRRSTDKRRWAKRDKLLAQLAGLLPGNHQDDYFYEGKVTDVTPANYAATKNAGRYVTMAGDDLVTFNDQAGTTRADVLKLLRRAAATYPNA